MSCVVCKAQERDLNDLQQRMAELVINQKRAMSVAERDYIGQEIRALEVTRDRSSTHSASGDRLGRAWRLG
jgi:hypothetical protein